MLEDVQKMLDIPSSNDILKVNGGTPNEDISKVMPAEDAALGFAEFDSDEGI